VAEAVGGGGYGKKGIRLVVCDENKGVGSGVLGSWAAMEQPSQRTSSRGGGQAAQDLDGLGHPRPSPQPPSPCPCASHITPPIRTHMHAHTPTQLPTLMVLASRPRSSCPSRFSSGSSTSTSSYREAMRASLCAWAGLG